MFRWGSIIQGEATPGVPVMIRGGATLEALVAVHIEAVALVTAMAIVAAAEGPFGFFVIIWKKNMINICMKQEYD